jgi:Spy/CpxP family protein refolding chaperone
MRMVLISAAGVLMGGALFAQQQRPSVAALNWWDNRVAVTSLNLSEAQAKQLNQIQQSYVNRLRDLREAVTKADRNLEDVFNEPSIDELKAQSAVDQYADARANMTRELTHMSLAMRSVLTAEQWQQLITLQGGRVNGRGGPGRGRRGPPNNGSGTTSNRVGPAISQK